MPLRLDRALEVDRRKDVIMIVIIFVCGVEYSQFSIRCPSVF